MTKKKKANQRGQLSTSGLNPSVFKQILDQMGADQEFARLMESKMERMEDPIFSTEKPIKPPHIAARNRIAKWKKMAVVALHKVKAKFPPGSINYNVDFTFEHVSKDGLIVARYWDPGDDAEEDSIRLFVNLKPEAPEPRMGCQCIHSLGQRPCCHTYTLLDWLTEMIEELHSEIYETVANEEFQTGEPDLSDLSKMDSGKVTKFLNDEAPLPAANSVSTTLPDVSELDSIDVQGKKRLCWDLNHDSHQPRLHLRLQTPKKRGEGWLKGKRVNCTNLLSAFEAANEVDRKIISRLTDHSLYYGRSLDFPLETLFDLLGQNNVSLDGKPITVKRFHPAVEYFEDDKHCGTRLKLANQANATVYGDDKTLTVILNSEKLVLVAECAPEVLMAVTNLGTLSELPLAAAPQLIEHLKGFQTTLPIDLPATKAKSDVVAETTTPVLLLRSRIDGTLDYGMRLRGSQGNLYKPGEGPLLIAGKKASKKSAAKSKTAKGGKAAQKSKKPTPSILRSPQKELTQSEQTLQQLGLPIDSPEGSLVDFEQAIEFLGELQNRESAGTLEVLWDKSSVAPVRVLGTVTPQNLRVSVGKSRDWLQLKGEAELPFGSIDLSELIHAVENSSAMGDYLKFGDKGWAKISRRLRRQLAKVSDAVHHDRKKLTFDATSVPLLQEVLGESATLQASKQWDACLKRIEAAQQLQPLIPENLNAELRSYQREGFDWLRRLAEWQVGGILADDMGLGKTLQALAVILDRAQQGPTLIVAPTSVGFNWQAEAERFTPDLNVTLYRDSDRGELLKRVAAADVVVCSYGLLLRDAEQLASVEWATMVLDEAQAVKNSRSKTALAAKSIPAQWKLALTGTPMENHLGELWSIFHVVAPGVFGGWENFRKRYALPIERNDDESRRIALRERIRPFVLRRTKSEVLQDLPPRHDQNILVELSPEERTAYDAARASALIEADEIAGLNEVKDQRFRLLALLTRLRQLACSPKMVDGSFDKRSAKLVRLAETLQQLKREGHRVLIFSQFVKHLHLIRELLTEEEISFEYLDGSTSAKARKESVKRFQEEKTDAFLISLKAGGTGLNLTAADYVIHMDPWWNPAVEDQATDRAHRMGQTKSVMCYRFVAKQTIEEEILKLHDSKRDLVAGVLEGSATAAKLSTDDLIALIRKRD